MVDSEEEESTFLFIQNPAFSIQNQKKPCPVRRDGAFFLFTSMFDVPGPGSEHG
jgi:hypothetical protein